MKKLFTLMVGFFLFSFTLQAQNQWLNFTYSNQVTSLARVGSLWWVGTTGGLIRYDTTNQSITLYNRGNANLPANEIKALTSDDQGKLWIATAQGLGSYDGTDFEQFTTENSKLLSNNILSVRNEKGKGIWVATDTSLCFYNGNSWTQYTEDDEGNPLDGITYLYTIGPYGIIFANYNRVKVLNHSGVFSDYQYPGQAVRGLTLDGLNHLYVASWPPYGGFYKLTSQWDYFNKDNSPLAYDIITDLRNDQAHNLYFLHEKGFSFKQSTSDIWSLQTDKQQIPVFEDHITTAIYPDSLGAIGLYDGLLLYRFSEVFNGGYTTHFKYSEVIDLSRGPLRTNEVSNLDFHNGKVYVGTRGVSIWNEQNKPIGEYHQGSEALWNQMGPMEVDIYGRVWCADISNPMGGMPGSFAVINHGKVTDLKGDSLLGFPFSGIEAIQWETTSMSNTDTTGMLWISFWGQKDGIAYYDGTSWQSFPDEHPKYPWGFNQFVNDNHGIKWFATSEGIYAFDGTQFISYHDSLSICATSVVKDKAGNLWFGGKPQDSSTGQYDIPGGLVKYDGKTWTRYTTGNSILPDNYVTSLAVDTTGNIWVGTMEGGILKITGDHGWVVLNHNNSPLDNNSILKIAVNKETNEVWIANKDAGIFVYDENGILYTDVPGLSTPPEASMPKLYQNYPNPFNRTTTLSYTLPKQLGATQVSLNIYNMMGQKISTLVNAIQNPGTYRVPFTPLIQNPGIYFYQLKAGNIVTIKKMILSK